MSGVFAVLNSLVNSEQAHCPSEAPRITRMFSREGCPYCELAFSDADFLFIS